MSDAAPSPAAEAKRRELLEALLAVLEDMKRATQAGDLGGILRLTGTAKEINRDIAQLERQGPAT